MTLYLTFINRSRKERAGCLSLVLLNRQYLFGIIMSPGVPRKINVLIVFLLFSNQKWSLSTSSAQSRNNLSVDKHAQKQPHAFFLN
ncbi:hypothetical protein FKM82_012915 [Ascaphus truei]